MPERLLIGAADAAAPVLALSGCALDNAASSMRHQQCGINNGFDGGRHEREV